MSTSTVVSQPNPGSFSSTPYVGSKRIAARSSSTVTSKAARPRRSAAWSTNSAASCVPRLSRWWMASACREPGCRPAAELGRAEYRAQVLAWCRELAARGYGRLSYPATCGGAADYEAFLAVFEALAFGDLSLLVKLGVHFGLFGGTLELPGCFAMTETGHGSNVYDLETTATYDAARQEFVVRTPHDGTRKDYIGNAALHGRKTKLTNLPGEPCQAEESGAP
jgi:hypothetical protein